MTKITKPFERKFFFQWMLASIAAWIITNIASFYDAISPIWLLPVSGFAQWYVLKYYLPKISWWIWTNILGQVISGAIIGTLLIGGLSLDIVVHPLLSGILTGTFVGVLQWYFLRQRVSKAGWWILANIVGLTLSKSINISVGILWGSIVRAVLGGLVFGGVTGFSLIWLLQSPISQRVVVTGNIWRRHRETQRKMGIGNLKIRH